MKCGNVWSCAEAIMELAGEALFGCEEVIASAGRAVLTNFLVRLFRYAAGIDSYWGILDAFVPPDGRVPRGFTSTVSVVVTGDDVDAVLGLASKFVPGVEESMSELLSGAELNPRGARLVVTCNCGDDGCKCNTRFVLTTDVLEFTVPSGRVYKATGKISVVLLNVVGMEPSTARRVAELAERIPKLMVRSSADLVYVTPGGEVVAEHSDSYSSNVRVELRGTLCNVDFMLSSWPGSYVRVDVSNPNMHNLVTFEARESTLELVARGSTIVEMSVYWGSSRGERVWCSLV